MQRSIRALLCATLLALGGCRTLLSGPTIIHVYRVTASEIGTIDSQVEGRKDLRIDHPKFSELKLVAHPASDSSPARIRLVVTPKDGAAVSLASEVLRVRSCGAANWSTVSFKVTGGKTAYGTFGATGDLPEKYNCFEAELPDLKVDDAVLRIGRVAFQLGEISFYGFGS